MIAPYFVWNGKRYEVVFASGIYVIGCPICEATKEQALERLQTEISKLHESLWA